MKRHCLTGLAALLLALPALGHPAIDRQLAGVNAQLQQQPDDAEALVARGRLYLEHGEPARAAADFSRATTLEPKLGDAWYWRAETEQRQGQAAAALASNARFLALHPDSPEHRAARARGEFQCGSLHLAAQQATEAARCLHAALGRGPAAPEQHLLYIRSLRASQQPDAALAAITDALAAHGDLPQLLDEAVAIERDRGRPAEALRWLDRALQQPHRREYRWLEKAQLQEQQGDTAGARRSLDAAEAALAALPPAKRHSQASETLAGQVRAARASLAGTP